MSISRVAVGMFSVGLLVLAAGVASGQAYPNKPLRICIAGVGGGAEIIGRLVAAGISGPMGQNVIVDARGAALVATEITAKSAPDGYTLLFIAGNLWSTPLIQKVSYDAVKDFSPISLVTSSPSVLVVHPSVPVKSTKELIALAKAKPGEINFPIGAPGANTHIAAELFKAMAGINLVMVPYKTNGAAFNAVLAGEVQMMFAGATGTEQYLKSGKVRGLGVTTAQPSALFPGLPTVASAGLPGFESATLMSVFAPAKTPVAIVRRLNEEIVRFANMPDTKARFLSLGLEAVGSSQEQLAAKMKSEIVRLTKLYKDIGLSAE